MTLSERLLCIAGMVTKGNPAVDVGCDHGYIPIYLVEHGISPSALACDLRRGPLEKAQENIAAAHLEEKIRTVLCDGVPRENLSGTLIIAGMGGPLTVRILKEAGERLTSFSEFVFEPQSDLRSFRQALSELGLQIEDEDMLREDGKYYTVIRAAAGNETLSGPELAFGPVLLKKKNHILFSCLLHQKKVKEDIRRTLRSAGRDGSDARMQEIEGELQEIAAALNVYGMQEDH